MAGARETCCICGRELPNRWAVAGRCRADGCGAAFCALHWHRGNKFCLEHGWRADGGTAVNGEEKPMDGENEAKELCERADRSLSEEKRASILKQIGGFAVALGTGTGALVKKLSGIKSTDEALSELDAQIAANRERREPLSRRYDELYREIVAKKKLYQSAPPARKKILELELKGAIAEYQSIERQISAYLSNETILTKVKGRMCELVAMSLKSVSEAQIDKLTDRIEEAADSAEDIDGAIGDLDKAGVRREREDGSFEDALAAFGDEMPEQSPEEASPAPSAIGEAPRAADPLADF